MAGSGVLSLDLYELYLCVDMVLCWMVLVLEDFICMQIDDLMLFGLIGNHIYAN
jgi:hypothetical protein